MNAMGKISIVILLASVFVMLAGCSRQENSRPNVLFIVLDAARADLQGKVGQLSDARAQLQERVDELTTSRDELQVMVESLVDARGLLEKQVAALTKARNAALEDAKVAQTKVGQLNDKLTVQTEQMMALQEQVKTIRAVLEQLQQKLE